MLLTRALGTILITADEVRVCIDELSTIELLKKLQFTHHCTSQTVSNMDTGQRMAVATLVLPTNLQLILILTEMLS